MVTPNVYFSNVGRNLTSVSTCNSDVSYLYSSIIAAPTYDELHIRSDTKKKSAA